jgi:hypothetical protein
VGGGQADAYLKSYVKVESGDLFKNYYEPDYVEASDKSQ